MEKYYFGLRFKVRIVNGHDVNSDDDIDPKDPEGQVLGGIIVDASVAKESMVYGRRMLVSNVTSSKPPLLVLRLKKYIVFTNGLVSRTKPDKSRLGIPNGTISASRARIY